MQTHRDERSESVRMSIRHRPQPRISNLDARNSTRPGTHFSVGWTGPGCTINSTCYSTQAKVEKNLTTLWHQRPPCSPAQKEILPTPVEFQAVSPVCMTCPVCCPPTAGFARVSQRFHDQVTRRLVSSRQQYFKKWTRSPALFKRALRLRARTHSRDHRQTSNFWHTLLVSTVTRKKTPNLMPRVEEKNYKCTDPLLQQHFTERARGSALSHRAQIVEA